MMWMKIMTQSPETKLITFLLFQGSISGSIGWLVCQNHLPGLHGFTQDEQERNLVLSSLREASGHLWGIETLGGMIPPTGSLGIFSKYSALPDPNHRKKREHWFEKWPTNSQTIHGLSFATGSAFQKLVVPRWMKLAQRPDLSDMSCEVNGLMSKFWMAHCTGAGTYCTSPH